MSAHTNTGGNYTTGSGQHSTEHTFNPLSSHQGATTTGAHSTSNNPISSTKDALDPTRGTGSHLGGARPADEVKTGGVGLGAHNYGHGGANLVSSESPNLQTSSHTGSHLPPAQHSSNPLSHEYDNAHSTYPTTGGTHTEHGAHEPATITQRQPGDVNPVYAAATGDHAHHTGSRDRAGVKDALKPTTGQDTHVGAGRADDQVKTTPAERERLKEEERKHTPGTAEPGHRGHPSSTATGAHKPTVAEKAKGAVETLVGKVTHNEHKVAEGQALKTGQHPAPSTY